MSKSVIIRKETQEVLWGFAKMGFHVGVQLRCPSCRGWIRVITVPNKKLKRVIK